MKKLMLAALVLFSSLAYAGGNEGTKYKVNTTESAITWKGKKVTGEHFGKLAFSGGELSVDGKNILEGNFTTDMNSITCEDLNEEYGNKLIGHLKSADFFNVAEYKNAKLSIKNIENTGGDNYTVNGTLEIKGISKEISFPAKVKISGNKIAARGEFKFDRTDFNIRYGSGKFFEDLGDKTIYDDVELSFVLIAEK